MMDATYVWSVIIITAVLTYLTRLAPFALLSNSNMPKWFTVWLNYVPTAIFGSMIFSEIFVRENGVNISLNNIYFIASLIVFPISLKTKSLGITIATGFIVFWLLQKQNFILLSF